MSFKFINAGILRGHKDGPRLTYDLAGSNLSVKEGQFMLKAISLAHGFYISCSSIEAEKEKVNELVRYIAINYLRCYRDKFKNDVNLFLITETDDEFFELINE